MHDYVKEYANYRDAYISAKKKSEYKLFQMKEDLDKTLNKEIEEKIASTIEYHVFDLEK